MEAIEDNNLVIDDDEGDCSSLEEPMLMENLDEEEEIESIVLPEGKELIGKEVHVVYDGKPLPGTVLKYHANTSLYSVKFKDKIEKDIQWGEMSKDKDGWTDFPESFTTKNVNVNHEFAFVQRDYDRINIAHADEMNALEIFLSFFPLKFWKKVCEETLRYGKSIKPSFDLHINELMRWLAIVIIWGIYHNFPSPLRFWSSHWVFDIPQIARIMTSTRFKEICRFLHLDNNAKDKKTDPFFKVRMMSDELNRTSLANYSPHCELSFDEMSPGSQHRTSLIVRTKHKKVPSAFDVKALCDGHNHYLIQHRLSAFPAPSILYQTATSCQVIAIFQACRLQHYHKIYFDNLYTTVSLFNYLFLYFKAYAVGTWRVNYGVPKQIQREKVVPNKVLEQKEIILKMARNTSSLSPPMIGLAIYDSKPFYMLSTITYPLVWRIGGLKECMKWDVQHDFNKFMGGVDLHDQLQISYNCYITSMKWWKRLFFFFLELAVVNSYIISKIITPITHLQFRLDLVTQIIDKFRFPLPTTPSPKRKNSTDLVHLIPTYKRLKPDALPPSRLEPGHHFPRNLKERKCCKVCLLKNIRTTTNFICDLCGIHLCLKSNSACWQDWHTKLVL